MADLVRLYACLNFWSTKQFNRA